MNRLLSLAVFGAAMLCSSAHAVQTEVALLSPVKYDDAASIPQKVREECRLDHQLESEISNALVRYFKVPNGTTTSTDGQVVRVTITYVLGPAAGAFSGPKSITILAELMHDGKVDRATKLHRTSVSVNMFKGTCAILDKDARVLAKDVVKWIENPSYGTNDDVIPPAAADSAPTASAQ